MADETWPSTLPQYVNRDDFSFSLTNSAISQSMSTGYDKRRKRFTGQYATYDISMQVTQEQAALFEQFFNNNLGYGTVWFDFPDPLFIDDTIEVRVVCGEDTDPYSYTTYGDNEQLVLSFSIERLITGYTSVTATTWPTTLPQTPQYSDYNTSTQSGVVRDSDEDSGYLDVRRRFTAVTKYHNMSFIMTREQLVIFFNFYASLGYGAVDFTAPWPNDDNYTMRARFTAGDGYTVEYYDETDLFSVAFTWEELPTIRDWT